MFRVGDIDTRRLDGNAGDVRHNVENEDTTPTSHAIMRVATPAGGGDPKHLFDFDGSVFHMGVDADDSILKIGSGDAVGTTSAIYLDGSGNVGIGIAPVVRFHVEQSVDAGVSSRVRNPNAGIAAGANFLAFADVAGAFFGAFSSTNTGTTATHSLADAVVITDTLPSPAARMVIGTVNAAPVYLVSGNATAIELAADQDVVIPNGNLSIGDDVTATFDFSVRRDPGASPVVATFTNLGTGDARGQWFSTGGDSYLSLTNSDGGNQITTFGVRRADSNAFVLSMGATMAVNEALRIDRTNRALRMFGGIGAFNTTAPAVQPSKISDPSGGAIQDAEARTAIDAIIDVLEGAGLSAP